MTPYPQALLPTIVTLQRGFDLPEQDRRPGPVPVVASTSIVGTHDEYKILPPAVITGRSGSLGTVLYLDQPCWPLNTTLWVKDFHGNEPRYVYYLLQTLGLERFNSGAGVPTLNRNHLGSLLAPLAEPPEQKKIASILSAYDDLIENNLRRIRILEGMAQALYREWFVEFRFPGSEKFRLIESRLGRLPEGWEFQPLEHGCRSLQDGDWIETKDQGGNDFRLLQVSNIGLGKFIETGNSRWISRATFDRLRCTEVEEGDILVSRMPDPIGRAWLVQEAPWRMVTAVDVAILRPNNNLLDRYFCLCQLNSDVYLSAVGKKATGTTRARVPRSVLAAMPTLFPPIKLQRAFAAIAGPQLDLARLLDRSNDVLRSTRDLLVPRLISGELDVSDLDIAVPEATA